MFHMVLRAGQIYHQWLRGWPWVSSYRASVRTQLSKNEIITSLFKRVSDTEDQGIIREQLIEFHCTSGLMPEQIIIFRDGVSESQFDQVLNTELGQIIEACKFFNIEHWSPKFKLIVAQKNHHTKFFQANGASDNVPAGTVVDSEVRHPRNNDFYLCARDGMLGTTRPTHYHVLYDEIGFSTDDLQEVVHALSYVSQRSTTAISVVAPIRYAHLAAAQMAKVIGADGIADTSSSHSGDVTSVGDPPVPELPRMDSAVASSMFFC